MPTIWNANIGLYFELGKKFVNLRYEKEYSNTCFLPILSWRG